MNTVVKWSNISRRSVLIAVMLFIILFLFWWSILPVPLFQDPYATVLFDREGQVMGMKVADDGQMRFEEVQDLPPRYVISVLVFEDRYFLAHQGVNWWALCRALVQNIQAGHVVSGGSTLSMQVVRLALGNPPRTVPEKIREIFLTLRMEQSYSKKQILEMYASHAPFGGNVVGIRAAALKYFNRRPEQLSWAEAALLAVLPNAPALLYHGKNNTLLKQKRDGLLAKLYREGVMSEDSYHLALAEPLPEKKFDIPTVAPHLLAKAYREKKGKVCPTYIDGRLQKKINEIVTSSIKKLSIKTPSMKEHISNLSGGNQQKVIVARWLANDPDVLIMDEPTRGIDVGAKHEIYEIMCDLAKQGKAIIMISSEMSELLGMSDRICVMCNGKLTGEVKEPEDMTQAKIMEYATRF